MVSARKPHAKTALRVAKKKLLAGDVTGVLFHEGGYLTMLHQDKPAQVPNSMFIA